MSERYRRILDEGDKLESDAAPRRRRGILERQVEWLSLGLSVVVLGFALLLKGIALTVLFPLIAGGILLTSAIVQKIGRNWNVSIVTWLLGVFLLSYGITQLLRLVQPSETFSFFTYFGGSVIILGGVVLLLQVFRRA